MTTIVGDVATVGGYDPRRFEYDLQQGGCTWRQFFVLVRDKELLMARVEVLKIEKAELTRKVKINPAAGSL